MEEKLQHACPFCRHTNPNAEEEFKINCMRRIEANDPAAMVQMAVVHCYQEGDYKFTKVRLNISQEQPHWETWKHILIFQ